MSIEQAAQTRRDAEKAHNAAKMEVLRQWVALLRRELPRVKWVARVGYDYPEELSDKCDKYTGAAWVKDHCLFANLIDGYGLFLTDLGGYGSVAKVEARDWVDARTSYGMQTGAITIEHISYISSSKPMSVADMLSKCVAAVKADRAERNGRGAA